MFSATLIAQPVSAQVNTEKVQKFSDTAAKLKKGEGTGAASTGITIVPGVIVTTTAFTEGGYDTNPDQSFDATAAGYLRSGVGLGLTAIGEHSIANISASGSWLHLGDEVAREDRLNGAIEANVAYLLMPGVTISGGGLFEHDGLTLSEDETAGAFVELGYENKLLTGYVRGRFVDLSYLSESPAPTDAPPDMGPLFLSSAFDAQRSEVSTGLLIGNYEMIGLYGELNAAKVDYVEQPLEAMIDRDGDDYYAKTGIRVQFSRDLRGDFGWRWNRRELEDSLISEYNSNFVDASITWRPSPFFWVNSSIERTIGEASSPAGLLTDVRSFELKAGYQPIDGVGITVRGVRQLINEIGAEFTYQSTILDAEVTYNYSTHTQFYAGSRYEFLEEDKHDQDYDRFRIGAGVRVALDGHNPLRGVGAVNPIVNAHGLRLPSGAELSASVGYSWFNLPSMSMTTVVGGTFFDQAIDRIEDHSGDFTGMRYDVRLTKMAEHTFASGETLGFGLGGFFAYYDDTEQSHCDYTAKTDCAMVNIVDFDHEEENNTGPFGKLETTTEREVYYWGVAVDARLGRKIEGGLKDSDISMSYQSPFKIGLAVRGLNQRGNLQSIDTSVPDPVGYNERLDTQYYGGFLGIEQTFLLGGGWRLAIDGTAGAYHAYTDYEGRYLAYVPIGGEDYILERGSVDDADEKTSFIGTVRLDLQRSLGWASLGIYGQAEYLSYVPKVLYNNDDYAGGSPFGIAGTQCDTLLTSDSAFNYTLGLSLAVAIE